MIERIVFVAGWIAVVVFMPITFVCALVAVWFESERWGGVAGVFGVAGLILAFILAVTWMDKENPKPLPPRAVRERLRKERERIEFEARLAEMEREAGLR